MKKLMIAAAIICAAAVSQAATYSWQWQVTGAAETIFDGDDAVPVVSTMAYLFEGYTSESAMWESADATLASLRAGEGVPTSSDSAMLNASGKMDAAQKFSHEDFTGKNYMYAVIVAEGKNGKYAAIVDAAKGGATVGETSANFDFAGIAEDEIYGITDLPSNEEWQGWYKVANAAPVPEPTSGLLLLLGVAGLALRRRRA